MAGYEIALIVVAVNIAVLGIVFLAASLANASVRKASGTPLRPLVLPPAEAERQNREELNRV